MKKALFTFIFALSSLVLIAQPPVLLNPASAEPAAAPVNTDTLLIIALGIIIGVAILVLIIAIYALIVLRTVLINENPADRETSAKAEALKTGVWNRIFKSATGAVPVEKESTILLEHDYDGIRELDNHLPPWWKWLFYISIAFGALYLLAFHVFHIFPLSGEEYKRQVAKADTELKAKKAQSAQAIDENNVVFSNDPAIISNGKAIFIKNCVACHAADGGGGVGPNLTDKFWIHGGSIRNIFNTIKYGVPDKGMITWQSLLNPTEIRDVACYIYTLEGTKPANPKEPQGEIDERKGSTVSNSDSTTQASRVLSKDSVVSR